MLAKKYADLRDSTNVKIQQPSIKVVQKVCSLPQLATTDVHHILSLLNKVSCNWHALFPLFLPSTDSDVEKLLLLGLQANHLPCISDLSIS